MSSKKWMMNEWRRKQSSKERTVFLPFEKEAMEQVTRPGLYWFTDINNGKWFAQILGDGTALKLEVGALYPFKVDSLGVGEFIGPLPI